MTLSFDHYALFVDELARSVEFYRDVLGLQEVPEPFRDGRHVWFAIGGHRQLHIITPRQTGARPTADVHFAFHVEALHEFVARLERLGIPYGDDDRQPNGKIRTRPDGIPQIYFQDPDGHWLEVNETKY